MFIHYLRWCDAVTCHQFFLLNSCSINNKTDNSGGLFALSSSWYLFSLTDLVQVSTHLLFEIQSIWASFLVESWLLEHNQSSFGLAWIWWLLLVIVTRPISRMNSKLPGRLNLLKSIQLKKQRPISGFSNKNFVERTLMNSWTRFHCHR